MSIRPLGNRIVVKPDPIPTKTDGGLFIPENAIFDSSTGVVVATYDGCTDLKIGDNIMYDPIMGIHYEDVVVLHTDAVFGNKGRQGK